jgi:hypothetical protein
LNFAWDHRTWAGAEYDRAQNYIINHAAGERVTEASDRSNGEVTEELLLTYTGKLTTIGTKLFGVRCLLKLKRKRGLADAKYAF